MIKSKKIVRTPVSNTGGNSQDSTSYINLEYTNLLSLSFYQSLDREQRGIVDRRVIDGKCIIEAQKTKIATDCNALLIDTLSITGKLDDFPSNTALTDIDVINQVMASYQSLLGLTIENDSTGGMNGYHQAHKLIYTDGRPFKNLGFIAWGGNRATYQVYLTGEACEYLQMIDRGLEIIYDVATHANQKIKRIDIAYDDFQGEYNIQTALDLYEAGEFRITRNPKITQIGDFLNPNETDGRTVYIGSRDNGKMMRIYEKGKQLGETTSPWVRWELELKAVDRIIPLDALLNYDEYFKGAYPVLANFTKGTASRAIKTIQKMAKIVIDKAIEHASNGAGKLINVMVGLGNTPEQIVEKLQRDGFPKRLIFPINKISKKEVTAVLTNHSPIMDEFHYQLN